MKRIILALAFACAAVLLATGALCQAPDSAALLAEAKDSPERVLVDEDFETDNGAKMVEWYAGPLAHTFDFSGVTDEQAFSGKKSYKLQVTFPAGKNGVTYIQLPTDIPVWSDVNVKMRVKLQCDPAPWCAHGLNWGDAEAATSGNIYRGLKTSEENGWELWDTTIKADSGISRSVMGATLMIFMPDLTATTTLTVYVDKITITAKLPADWAAKWAAVYEYYTVDVEKAKREDARQRLADMKKWGKELARAFDYNHSDAMKSNLHVQNYEAAWDRARQDYSAAVPLIEAIEKALADENASFAANLNRPERLLNSAKLFNDNTYRYFFYEMPKSRWREDLISFVFDITQSYPILPQGPTAQNIEQSYYDWNETGAGLENPQVLPHDSFVSGVPGQDEFYAFGCRDTIVPLSFAIRAGKDLEGLTFTATDLRSGKNVIKSSAVDIRIVAPWFRPFNSKPRLMNEILVHDPEFVTPIDAEQKNHYKSDKFPEDSKTLLPVTIPAGTNRQFYATVKIPARAMAGYYKGKLVGKTRNGVTISFDVRIEVLPFNLKPTPYAYGAYYRTYERSPEQKKTEGVESPGTFPVYRTLDQMQAEFISMAEHGFNTAMFYEGTPTKTSDSAWDFSKLEKLLSMAKKAGLVRSPFVWLGHGMHFMTYPYPGAPTTPEEVVARINELVPAANKFCKDKGYPQPAFYGEDEASGDKLIGLRAGYSAATKAGGIVAAACNPTYYTEVGDALSLPIILGGGQTEAGRRAIQASRKAGYECWTYNVPCTNMAASPSVYRRRYGLSLWKNGEQGAMPWELSGMLSYNFDYEHQLHAFAYPTVSGKPIDTIIYEAFREGIYDTRYMATLQYYLKQAKARKAAPELTAKIDKWLASFSVNDDLQKVRRQMADYTVKLIKAK